jgi:hypothetical protein
MKKNKREIVIIGTIKRVILGLILIYFVLTVQLVT